MRTSRLTQAAFVLVTLGLAVSILGIIGVVGSPLRAYCFAAFPILLLAFVWLKKRVGKEEDEFKDTPWGL
jgi:uncharacterized membrane protein YbaN (DUF454 family)